MGHVADPNFGIKLKRTEDGKVITDDYAFVSQAFQTLPVFKGDEARLALDMAFDAFYGLQRMEQSANRPLMSIAIGPLEDYGVHGPMYKALEIYAKSSVGEFFPGLSVEVFMDLPREIRNYLLTISESLKITRYQEQKDLIDKAGMGPKGLPGLGNLQLNGKR